MLKLRILGCRVDAKEQPQLESLCLSFRRETGTVRGEMRYTACTSLNSQLANNPLQKLARQSEGPRLSHTWTNWGPSLQALDPQETWWLKLYQM